MSNKLEINTQIIDDKAIIEFLGPIDEDANFEKVVSISPKQYIFDFDKVSMINSCGIREWISFLEKIDSKASIVYRNCPQVIIEQINMVKGFIRDGALIESFYAPYYCEESDEEIKVHLKASEVLNRKAPKKLHTVNGKEVELEFDAIEEQYFSFLK